MAERGGRLGDTVFALVHLALLAGAIIVAVLALLKGNTWRFLVVACALLVYYFAVLDKPVRGEIARRKGLRAAGKGKSLHP
jgi:uncharacterized membrane protein YoaK (UPF0700 family)